MTALPIDPRGRELTLMIERAKYERWLSHETADILSGAFNEVVDAILSPTFRTLSNMEQTRKLALFRELDRLVRSGYHKVVATVAREAQGYSQLEFEIGVGQIQTMLTDAAPGVLARVNALLSRHQVRAVAELPIQGLSLGEWFEGQASTMSRETRRILQNGLLQGKSAPEMARAIVPPKLSLEPALYRRARSESMTIVRTTVNAVQNAAAIESYIAAGPDVSDSSRLVAVRDARTTAICRGLDGLVQKNDNPRAKWPPFHMGCRTSVVPIVRAEFLSRAAQQQPFTYGSYDSWLREQGTSMQDSILGAARAEWWRKGKMSLADAIDQDNRVLTLAQLRKKLGLETPFDRGRVAI